jgi:uncharacterized membrane protein
VTVQSPPATGIVKTRSSSSATRPPRPKREHAWPKLDVAVTASLGVIATAAATSLPAGTLRTALTLPMILFVPGYLLLQAFVVPAVTGAARGWQALASLGISPAVLGLFALATSIVQGGFRLDAIVVLSTIGCLAFAAAALVRRRSLARSATTSKTESAKAGTAATAKSGPVRP